MHKLSNETLENLLIALARAKDERGLIVHIRPQDAFTPFILNQLPCPPQANACDYNRVDPYGRSP